ncbi:hypothetical protein H4F76_25275, partial [Enterobacter hormaechei]|nr:hypothetical protein [Enterobacter hormaechei]
AFDVRGTPLADEATVLEAGLAQVGASEPSKRIITGAVIVVAVIIDTLRQRRADRRAGGH